jgi:hypothetical protein
MKLLFENVHKSYAGFDDYLPILVGACWLGIAEVENKLGEKLVKEVGVEELNDSDWDWYKKKSSQEAIAYRQFGTIKQDSSQNPNADYAQEVGSQNQSSTSDKEIIEVDVEEVAPPKADEVEVTPKKRGKK